CAPGAAVSCKGWSRLSRWREGILVADCMVPQLGFRGGSFHLWLMQAYGSGRYSTHLNRVLEQRAGTHVALWLCHPFAARPVDFWKLGSIVFDAFDNFAIHPELSSRVHSAVAKAYQMI